MSASFAAVLLTVVLAPIRARACPFAHSERRQLTPAGRIDELVFARLKKLGLRHRRFAPMPSFAPRLP